MDLKPRLVLALAMTSALLVVSGCGGGGEEGESAQISTQGAAQTPSEEGQARGGEASIEEFGSEAKGAERAEILTAFTGYLEALGDEDYVAACAGLSTTVQSSLEQLAGKAAKGGCSALLPKLLASTAARTARQQAGGEVIKVRVEGERAFVVFKAPGAKLFQQTMVEEGGEWKVATVAASVLVPEL